MNDQAEKIAAMALMALPQDKVASEDEIRDIVGRLTGAFGLTGPERERAIQIVFARRLVKMDLGYALSENHVPWVNARKPEIDPFFWNRYRLMLHENWAPGVIVGLDKVTDEILDLMGNPAEPGTWKRRGLVMGDVQSGKTATYSALICKAADAGYRFVILLTGTIENLRRQTQERLDAAFVGFDSSELLKRDSKNLRTGVGFKDGTRQATVFTSSSADFRSATLDALGLSLDALKEPALVVIKKHTRIMDNLKEWLTRYNMGAQEGGIDKPLLLIDDEADNASINTNDPGRDPTAVNAGIRSLLSLFRRTTYVGFTATPFANIFVNPDSNEEMLGDDLFPTDFIYSLQSPSNYFGTRSIFRDEEGARLHLRRLDDMEESLPAKHKQGFEVRTLPESLMRALHSFLVVNAIRDLRGHSKTHRSMLVNVSRFTRIQDRVEELLHIELEAIQAAVRSFSALPPEKALQDRRIRSLHDAWRGEFSGCGFDWPAVQGALHNAVLPVTTKAVNQGTGPQALDYRAHREAGLRVVAVGGNSLSRGLTLEGLMVSYFRRTTAMYDTLLQMGRWFGYRDGFKDLCRVWLPPSAIDWYGHICDATDELREELRRMARMGRTPKDFGLEVRAHPDSLLVTARNKMRSAKEIVRVVSLSGQSFESVELPVDPGALKRNYETASAFMARCIARPMRECGGGFSAVHVATRAEVAKLLRAFTVPLTAFRFQPARIAEMLENLSGDALLEWDVSVPSGNGDRVLLGGVEFLGQSRSMLFEDPPGHLVVSGNSRRVGSRGAEAEGLSPEQRAAAVAKAREWADREASAAGEPPPAKLNVSDRFYRAERVRPLLLIHLLKGQANPEGQALPEMESPALVAIGLSFPPLGEESGAKEVKYRINLIRARELFSTSAETDDDEEMVEVGP